MRADFKKRANEIAAKVRELASEWESFEADFEEWVEDHNHGWEYTKAGERANDELIDIQQIDFESIAEDIEGLTEPKE